MPGLGQVYQGRVGKGVLFMVCLLGMFISGQALGEWHNVFMPNKTDIKNINPTMKDLNPWHLPGPIADCISYLGAGTSGPSSGWASPPGPPSGSTTRCRCRRDGTTSKKLPENENRVNDYLRDHDKMPDLAWVYTVIAGMLNILVIYDAYAGAVHSVAKEPEGAPSSQSLENKQPIFPV